MNEQNTFHIGICMAGAISAGAYTAGVIDYLLEALENWQNAKELQEQGKIKGIPKHNIQIQILSGASAGGMTAALTSAAIQTNFEHVYNEDIYNSKKNKYIDKNIDKLSKNPLYHSWVNLTEDENNDMMDVMLSTDDITNNGENPDKEVRSLFNSMFIKTIAERHIKNNVISSKVKRPYIADDLEVLATLTNLRGIPFEVKFNTTSYSRMHRMTRHFDIAHFKINTTGNYEDDGKIPLHFENTGCNKDILVQAAMATGGFPIGLEPRVIKRLGKYIKDNKYLNLGDKKDLQNINDANDYVTLNIDGGTINNDPFELTQNILDDKLVVPHNLRKTKAEDFVSTVLMIDPFPNHSDLPKVNYKPLKAFKFILSKIISAMLGELRMKEDVLKAAIESEDYTKYLIIPSRSGANPKKENHIACGSLGGFGGFFSKKFRKHDFLLGRRNCQQFLKKHFSVPLDKRNPILEYGYEGIEEDFDVEVNGKSYLPLIPDIRIDQKNNSYTIIDQSEYAEGKFIYPSIKLSYLLGLKKSLEKRISMLLKNITNGKDPDAVDTQNEIVIRIRKKPWYKKALSAITIKPLTLISERLGKKIAKGIISNQFIDIVIKDMDDNELLHDDLKN